MIHLGTRALHARVAQRATVVCFGYVALMSSLAVAVAQSDPHVATHGKHTAAIPHAPFTEQDASTLRQMLQQWFVDFSAKNYAAIDHFFAAPYTMLDGQTVVLADMPQVVTLWTRTRNALDGTAYSHTEVVGLRIIPRSGTQALLNIHWRRVNQDGSTLDEGSEFYLAAKQDGRWQFNGGMSQDLALFGKY